MEASGARSLLQQYGLPVEAVAIRPPPELYTRCKLGDPKDIRIIRLFPATSDPEKDEAEQPLIAQMFSESLSKLKGQYEALSYVWGSGEKPKTVTIISVELPSEAFMFDCSITENLWMALRDLRNTTQPRDIWIDALCINQDDSLEKNVQVAQMRDVYAGAKRTVAHLGPPFDGLEALIAYRDCHLTKYGGWVGRPSAPGGQFMRFFPERGILRVNQTPYRIGAAMMGMFVPYFYLRYGLAVFTPRSFAHATAIGVTILNVGLTLKLLLSENKFALMLPSNEPEVIFYPDQILYGLAEFFVRPWFRRAWIVQECVVSPTVCFMVGREEFDIDEIERMTWDRAELRVALAGMMPASSHVHSFQRMLRIRRSKSEGELTPSLSTLLMWAWSYGVGEEATDPRDKIFALLGLLDDKNPEYFVDYDLESEEVFWRYGKILSRTPERFMLLEDPRRHNGSSMPCWVPDFSKTIDHSLHGLNDFYSSSEGIDLSPYQLNTAGDLLEVRAILLKGIDHIGRQYAPIPVALPELHRVMLSSTTEGSESSSSAAATTDQLIALNKSLYASNLELREDIKGILKNSPMILLPKGLDSETAAEVLLQVGIFFDQPEGSIGPPRKSQLYQAEKFLDSKYTQDLLAKTVTAARYFCLHIEGLLSIDTREKLEALAMEYDRFFVDWSEERTPDRSRLFQRLEERKDNYPLMSQQPLLKALSKEEWPPESMRNDASIPRELYNDDRKLLHHFETCFSMLSGNAPWAERRLAKTGEGYLCNIDKDTQLGDRIAVVAGCRMPLILRPRVDGTFRVVGHAYVMCLMYGNAMELGIESEQIWLS